MLFGIVLVMVGAIALLAKQGILTGSALGYIWPALLIVIGLALVLRRIYGRRIGSWVGCCCAPQQELKDR